MTDKEFAKLKCKIEKKRDELQKLENLYRAETGYKYVAPVYLRPIWARRAKCHTNTNTKDL